MKQEATKKNKKLIWLIVGLVALLLVVGAVLAILLIPGQQSNDPTGPVGGRPDLYWNVDRHLYIGNEESAGLSIREPAEDGLYHIRFAHNGKLVEYTFADKRLVNVIDNQDVIGLTFDADGNPIDAIDPTTIATEVAKSFFVMRNKDGVLTVNSSIAMNGMEIPIQLGNLTEIYDVRTDAENPGAIVEVEMMDKVVVYANDKGETTHVYITERQPAAGVYWRVGKYYNSTTKETTRVPDENGVYTLTFAKDGKQVELKCKDKAIVTNIDQKGGEYNAPKGLQVDEEGYIIAEVDPVIALRGKLAGSEYHITEMNGSQITATYLLSGKEQGKTFTVDVPEDCPIYNVCVGGSATMIGEPTELQMYDRIICYTDLDGKPILIYVMYRMANVPMYWNITRMYDSTKQETARVPDANGYYVFKMTVGGKQVTLRTKDKAIATQIDSFSYFMCGLEVEGDIIKRVYKPVYVSGNDQYGAGGQRFVVDQIGTILSFVTTTGSSWSPVNLVLHPNVEVYDVTGYPGTKIGEKTTYEPGDTIRIVADYNNNITHIYVVARYTGEPIYYNYSRQYSTSKSETTRKPDADGYYVFEMASRGKEYTKAKGNALKTKDKAIANIIDAQNAPIVALDVDKNGIIKAAYEAVTSLPYGYKTSNYHWFQSLNGDGTYTTIVHTTGKTYNFKVAEDCKVYNVSQQYKDHRGEKVSLSDLRPDDRIQAVATKDDGLVKEIYIMTREVESKLYYNISRKYNSATATTTRVPAESGEYAGYYVFDMVVDGKIKQFITKDKDIASMVDYFNYVPFGMTVSGNVIKSVFPATYCKDVKATAASNYDVTKISGNNVTVTRYLPSTSNIGATVDLKLASNYKAYDVSSYSENFGGKVKLGLGDRAVFYTNEAGEVEWIYIWYKNTHEKGHISYCEHCDKKVYWQPYSGDTYSSYEAGDQVHLYVTNSVKKVGQENHGVKGMPESDRTEVILDLNGQTLRPSATRSFLVYGTLSIVDTVGGGKIEGGIDKGSTANGGAIMLGEGGILNLYSGTLTENPNNTINALGGVLYVGYGSTFNMYGGTIEGGTATSAGGNVYVNAATFNMEGGTIAGDIDVVSKDAKVTVSGDATITAGKAGGLILAQGVTLPLDGITDETKVVVDAQGVFTEESDDIDSYLDNFQSSVPEFPVFVQGKALAGGKLAYCPHCDKDVYWTKFSGKSSTGHYIMVDDFEQERQITIGSHNSTTHSTDKPTCNHTTDVVIDLNGHTLTTGVGATGEGSSTGRFALVYGGLSVLDSSEEQTGKITSVYGKETINAGLILASTGAKLNLYSGELTVEDGVRVGVGGVVNMGAGTFNMYGGKITNGTAIATTRSDDGYSKGGQGGNLYIGTYGTANIYGGEITGGKAISNVMENFDGTTGKTTYSFVKDAKGNSGIGAGGNIYNEGKLYIGYEDETLVAGIGYGEARSGGNIYSTGTTVIKPTGVVAYGVAAPAFEGDTGYNGGNIYVSSKTLTVQGIVGEGVAYAGGNIAASGATTTTIDGGMVFNGVAEKNSGGNFYTNNGILKMSNEAILADGEAVYRGGNVYLGNGGELHMADAYIAGGTAGNSGGNVYMTGREMKDNEDYPEGYDFAILTAENSYISGGVSSATGAYTGGGNVYAYHSKITLNGTNVADGAAEQCGGNILVSNGSLTLGDGTVVEGGELTADAAASGGYMLGKNICKFNAGVLDIQAGAVATGGTGKGTGTVYISDGTKSTGAVIVSGTVEGDLNVGSSTKNVTVSGAAKINKLSIPADYKINVGEMEDGAEIYVNAKSNGVFTNVIEPAGTAAEYTGYFFDANGTTPVNVKDEALMLGLMKYCEHCDQEVLWTGLNPNATNYTGVQHLIATEDTEMADQFTAGVKGGSGHDIVIDLNGKTVSVSADAKTGRFALLYGTMSIYDTSADQTGVLVSNKSSSRNGGLIQVGSGTLNIYGGTLTLGEGVSVGRRGGLIVSYATVNVYGGKLVGGVVTSQTGVNSETNETELQNGEGGNIYISAGGKLNVYGGEIIGGSGNIAVDGTIIQGGNIASAGGTIVIEGGKISGGTANEGGNIYTIGRLNITGGEVTGGVAAPIDVTDDSTDPATVTAEHGLGGNIYLGNDNKQALTVGAAAKVTDGEARIGGNIYARYYATVLGTVSGGKATEQAGNIWHGGTLNVGQSDGTVAAVISDGEAPLGGNIYSTWKLVVYKGATVSGGKSTDHGGSIYVNYSNADAFTDIYGTVTGGESAANGGNIYVYDGKLDVLEGGVVSDGNAKNGGNIGLNSSKTATIYGTVSGGESTAAGGNITGAGSSNIIVDGGTVTGGKAGTSGGNIQSNNGYITLLNGATVSDGEAATYGGNIGTNQSGAGRKVEITGSTVTGGQAGTNGGNIYVAGTATNQGILNITDSTISGGKSTADSGYNGGGNIYVARVDAVINNSTVSGGEVVRYGGNILATNANVTLGNGTVVEGGNAGIASGDSICKWNSGDLEIQAGAAVKADAEGNGGVYMNNATADTTANLKIAGAVEVPLTISTGSAKGVVETTVSGDAKVAKLILPEGYKINVGAMTENADVKVSAETGVFTNAIADSKASEYAKYFSDVNGVMPVEPMGDALALGYVRACEHCEGEEAIFLPYSDENAVTTGHWIVTEPVSMATQLTIGAHDSDTHGATDSECVHDVDSVVDLNGQTITVENCTGANSQTGRYALVYAGLSIQDSSAEGAGKIITTYSSTRSGGLILSSTGSEVNLYGGELTAAEGVSAGRGGIVLAGAGTFNMYGGKITNGNVVGNVSGTTGTTGYGGNVSVSSGAKFNMYGGLISNGSGGAPIDYTDANNASKTLRTSGGNMYIAGEVNLYDGAVIDGGQTDRASGGNIMVAAGGKLNIHGGATVSNGVATSYSGGNIYSEGTINIGAEGETKEAVISGGKGSRGGNIRAAGTINIYANAKISGGEATSTTGGNLDLSSCVLTMHGGIIENGIAKTIGGNVNIKRSGTKGSFTMNAGTIQNGEAGTNGGNIGLANGLFTINGGTITGGKATTSTSGLGGNIHVTFNEVTSGNTTNYYGSTVSIAGGTVENGEANLSGGNIYVVGKNANAVSTVTIQNGAIISGGNAKSNPTTEGNEVKYTDGSGGGNLFIANFANVTIDGAATKVENGIAGFSGGNIYMSGAAAKLEMKEGTIKGGNTLDTNTQDNVRLSNKSSMIFTGGTIYGTNGTTGTGGSAITVNNATLRVGGAAKVAREDGSKAGLVYVLSTSKMEVLTDFTGEMSFMVGNLTSNFAGADIPVARVVCGTVVDGTFTAGGTCTGTLTYGNDALAVSIADATTGAMKIAAS